MCFKQLMMRMPKEIYVIASYTSVFLVLATMFSCMRLVIGTCAIETDKMAAQHALQDLLLHEIEVLLFQMLAPS